jgi:rubrerythrin
MGITPFARSDGPAPASAPGESEEDDGMDRAQLEELLFQALETERGGIKVYEEAVRCAQNDDLREEWQKYLDETRNHEVVVTRVMKTFELDPETDTVGRRAIRDKGETLVASMQRALEADPSAAQLVAAESVVEAESKDHMNWLLIGEVAKELSGDEGSALEEAFAEVGEQENEHLYHTMGWTRELWLESLGLPAVLPPPEEEKHTTTAIGADRARQQREEML